MDREIYSARTFPTISNNARSFSRHAIKNLSRNDIQSFRALLKADFSNTPRRHIDGEEYITGTSRVGWLLIAALNDIQAVIAIPSARSSMAFTTRSISILIFASLECIRRLKRSGSVRITHDIYVPHSAAGSPRYDGRRKTPCILTDIRRASACMLAATASVRV